jgi:hypothetical protein
VKPTSRAPLSPLAITARRRLGENYRLARSIAASSSSSRILSLGPAGQSVDAIALHLLGKVDSQAALDDARLGKVNLTKQALATFSLAFDKVGQARDGERTGAGTSRERSAATISASKPGGQPAAARDWRKRLPPGPLDLSATVKLPIVDKHGRFELSEKNDSGYDTGIRSAKTGEPAALAGSSSGLTVSGRIYAGRVLITNAAYTLEHPVYNRVFGGKKGVLEGVIHEQSIRPRSAALVLKEAPTLSASSSRRQVGQRQWTSRDVRNLAAPLGTQEKLFGHSSYRHAIGTAPPTLAYCFWAQDPRLFRAADRDITGERYDSYDGRGTIAPSYAEQLPALDKVEITDSRMFLFVARCAELAPPVPGQPALEPERTVMRGMDPFTAARDRRQFAEEKARGDKQRTEAWQSKVDNAPDKRIREYLANPVPEHLSSVEALPMIVRMAQAAKVDLRQVRITLPGGEIMPILSHPNFPLGVIEPSRLKSTTP